MIKILKNKNIYIKKIKNANNYDIWLVNGGYIRKNINENFVEYDHHLNHSFVPKNELWVDNETNPDEWIFFIDHMFAELNLVKKTGKNIKEVAGEADVLEKQKREMELKKKHLYKLKNDHKELLGKVRKKFLEKYSNDNVKIWLVDGRMVRDFFFVEYAEGGHDKVYGFIPENEIWIDEILPPEEIKFIIFHELRERNLMIGGKNYREAHKGATLAEDYYRDHPGKLNMKIKKEMENESPRDKTAKYQSFVKIHHP